MRCSIFGHLIRVYTICSGLCVWIDYGKYGILLPADLKELKNDETLCLLWSIWTLMPKIYLDEWQTVETLIRSAFSTLRVIMVILENFFGKKKSVSRRITEAKQKSNILGPLVQSIVCLMSSLRVISLTVLADSIYNILIFFAEKNVSSFCTAKALHCKSDSHFFGKKFQNICVSLDVNFNESLTNDVVSFEQLGHDVHPLAGMIKTTKWSWRNFNQKGGH